MSILNKIFKNNSIGKTIWTDFDRPPKEVFIEACEQIAIRFEQYGFDFSKSGPHLTKKSGNGDFKY